MKKVMLLMLAMVFTVAVTNAQSKKVYGPKAKNQKVWINQSNSGDVVIKEKTKVTGANAKNQQVWVKAHSEAEVVKVSSEGKSLAFKKKLAQKNYDKKHAPVEVDVDELDENLTSVEK